MANLKLDLIENINKDKFYEEHELIRLAQEPSMNYKLKIELMQEQLKNLALINAELGLIEEYFREPAPAAAPAPAPEPAPAPAPAEPKAKVHQGQSHGEG